MVKLEAIEFSSAPVEKSQWMLKIQHPLGFGFVAGCRNVWCGEINKIVQNSTRGRIGTWCCSRAILLYQRILSPQES
jgi:hypothetical protein